MNNERSVAQLYSPQGKISFDNTRKFNMHIIYAMGPFCLRQCPKGKEDNIFDDFHIFDVLYSSLGERVCGKLYEERSY